MDGRLRPYAFAATFMALGASPSYPQNPLADGSMLIHGNYCGPGNRGYGRKPVDALDAACRRHDLCTPDGGVLPSCACNARLARDADRVSRDRRQPAELRDMAGLVANAARIPICRP